MVFKLTNINIKTMLNNRYDYEEEKAILLWRTFCKVVKAMLIIAILICTYKITKTIN